MISENMISRKDIEEWIEDIGNIIVDLNISIQNAERLTEDKFEFENQLKKHGFFQHHWYQLRFIIIIQLCKLLSNKPNEKRSFNKLFNRLENDKYESSLPELLNSNKKGDIELYKSKSEIKDHVRDLRNKIDANVNLIEKIISLRNKVYAHKDPNSEAPLVKFEELKLLTKISSEIYNELQFKFFFIETHLDALNDWSIDHVLWYISELKKNDDREREKLKLE
ncbi:MAG: hypothetical protein ACKV1O_15845 [Saprospiraceae bacterium]